LKLLQAWTCVKAKMAVQLMHELQQVVQLVVLVG
jgi:hypothetical protein